MRAYARPSVVEFGPAEELIQGCGGWGMEGFSLNDADSNYIWMSIDGVKKCICSSYKGKMC